MHKHSVVHCFISSIHTCDDFVIKGEDGEDGGNDVS